MEYSLTYHDNVIRSINLDRVLSEVSKVFVSPLKKSLTKKRSSDGLESERHLPQDKNHQNDTTEPLPYYSNYWLAQSDPNYVDQEESEAAFTRRFRRSSQHPADAVIEFLKNQQAVNQNDLKQALQGCLPNCIASERTTYGGSHSVGSSESSLSGTGVEMGFSHNMMAPCGSWINIEKAVKACRER